MPYDLIQDAQHRLSMCDCSTPGVLQLANVIETLLREIGRLNTRVEQLEKDEVGP